MPIDTTETRQKRGTLVKQARDVLGKADEEKRSLTAEDRRQYDEIWGEVQKLKLEIDDHERRNKLEIEEKAGQMRQEEEDRRKQADEDEQRTKNQNQNPRATEEYRSRFARYCTADKGPSLDSEEFRALQSDDDVSGGYLVIPEQMAAELVKDVDNLMLIRQWAKTITVPKARSLGIRRRTARMSSFAYSAELQSPTADSSLKYGKKVLTPHHMNGMILVSRDWLRNAVESPEQILRGEISYDAAETEEEKFMLGTGDGQPLGLFVASDDGISTSRDVSTGNSTTAITGDGLREAKYSLKIQYRRQAKWLFSRTAVKNISKLKDGQGQYIWQAGITTGDPDAILGLPVGESEYVPSTFTTGLYVGMLADFRWYYIADALDVEIQRLDELYAVTNQVAFIARLKNDGMPVLEEAFARVTLA